jgi:hypothetical protein
MKSQRADPEPITDEAVMEWAMERLGLNVAKSTGRGQL